MFNKQNKNIIKLCLNYYKHLEKKNYIYCINGGSYYVDCSETCVSKH